VLTYSDALSYYFGSGMLNGPVDPERPGFQLEWYGLQSILSEMRGQIDVNGSFSRVEGSGAESRNADPQGEE
jgi:hypothetical protein